MDAVQWTQETAVELEPMTEVAAPITHSRILTERRVRPQKDQNLNCQRCHSTNTKFCYYNNYNLSQPRYFCKTCRRYWTEGGSLRNVPVGGGSRKNRRSNRSSLSTTSSSITTITSSSASSYKLPHHDPNPPNFSHFSFQNPNPHDGQNLNLSFPPSHQYYGLPQFIELPKTHENKNNNHLSSFTYSSSSSSSSSSPSSVSTTTTPLSSLELLRTGINASSGGLSSSNDDNNINNNIPTPIPNSNILYTSGFGFQEIKPNLTFSIDGIEKGHGGLPGVQENGKALLFPFGAFKQLPTTSEVDQNKAQGNSAGYCNGMFGGGSW